MVSASQRCYHVFEDWRIRFSQAENQKRPPAVISWGQLTSAFRKTLTISNLQSAEQTVNNKYKQLSVLYWGCRLQHIRPSCWSNSKVKARPHKNQTNSLVCLQPNTHKVLFQSVSWVELIHCWLLAKICPPHFVNDLYLWYIYIRTVSIRVVIDLAVIGI